jgi:hypothetical protein
VTHRSNNNGGPNSRSGGESEGRRFAVIQQEKLMTASSCMIGDQGATYINLYMVLTPEIHIELHNI